MSPSRHVHPADLQGASHLAVTATLGLAELAEALHVTIAGASSRASAGGIAGLVYQSIRGVTRMVGAGSAALLGAIGLMLGEQHTTPEREVVLAALNGVLGDYLAASANPLAIGMQLRRNGQPLALFAPALAAAIPQPSGKLLLMAHGLCLNDLQWQRNGHDHGARLAAELGYTPVYLRYNTGLHISANGRELAGLLEVLLRCWPVPVEELTIVGHSMGGLVARSACHYGAAGGHAWPQQLSALVCLGSPHHGAPLERIGNWVNSALEASPYTAAFARLGKIRSAGITDLRHGSLRDEDWAARDRFAHHHDERQPVPLPAGVRCYAVAGTLGEASGDLRDRVFGDGLVPLPSALGAHAGPGRALEFPADHQWISYSTNHLDLLDRPEVYARLRGWLGQSS